MTKKLIKKTAINKENIVKVLEEFKDETIGHFDVVAEDIKSDMKLLSEQAASNMEKLEEHDQRFNRIDQRLDKVKNTLEIVKLDLESIKNDLKKKVDWDDFVVLEKRVSIMETRIK